MSAAEDDLDGPHDGDPDGGPAETGNGDMTCGCLGCSIIILLDLAFAIALYLALQSCN